MGIFFIVAFSFSGLAFAESGSKCFSKEKLELIAPSFSQLQPLIVGSQEEVCSDQLGPAWTLIAETLIDLYNLKVPDLSQFETRDDFSKVAVKESQWWKYFSSRASQFDIQPNRCRARVVAYVTNYLPGVIHLCEGFYKGDRISRLETLLHEVRHFDDFDHVTCAHGNLKGVAGACDENINHKGSYAISVQTNAALGLLGEGFTSAEKAFARASALFILNNQFNEETEIEIQTSLLLENEKGEVFDWSPENGLDLDLIKVLDQPAQIFTSSLETIFYPLDRTQNAYRLGDDFNSEASVLGLFAEQYNKLPLSERNQLISAGYNKSGGLLMKDKITIPCGGGLKNVSSSEFPEPVTAMISLIRDGKVPVDMMVSESGRLYEATCVMNEFYMIKPTELYVPRETIRAFQVNERAYGLTAKGQIFEILSSGNQFQYGSSINFSGYDEKWIEMSLRIVPYLYDEARRSLAQRGR